MKAGGSLLCSGNSSAFCWKGDCLSLFFPPFFLFLLFGGTGEHCDPPIRWVAFFPSWAQARQWALARHSPALCPVPPQCRQQLLQSTAEGHFPLICLRLKHLKHLRGGTLFILRGGLGGSVAHNHAARSTLTSCHLSGRRSIISSRLNPSGNYLPFL